MVALPLTRFTINRIKSPVAIDNPPQNFPNLAKRGTTSDAALGVMKDQFLLTRYSREPHYQIVGK